MKFVKRLVDVFSIVLATSTFPLVPALIGFLVSKLFFHGIASYWHWYVIMCIGLGVLIAVILLACLGYVYVFIRKTCRRYFVPWSEACEAVVEYNFDIERDVEKIDSRREFLEWLENKRLDQSPIIKAADRLLANSSRALKNF